MINRKIKLNLIVFLIFLIILFFAFYRPSNTTEILIGTFIGVVILSLFRFIPKIKQKLEVHFSLDYLSSMEYRIYMLILMLFYISAEYYSSRVFYMIGMFFCIGFLFKCLIDYFKREDANKKMIVIGIIFALILILLNIKKYLS